MYRELTPVEFVGVSVLANKTDSDSEKAKSSIPQTATCQLVGMVKGLLWGHVWIIHAVGQ